MYLKMFSSDFLLVNYRLILSFIFVTITFDFGISKLQVSDSPFVLITNVDLTFFQGN